MQTKLSIYVYVLNKPHPCLWWYDHWDWLNVITWYLENEDFLNIHSVFIFSANVVSSCLAYLSIVMLNNKIHSVSVLRLSLSVAVYWVVSCCGYSHIPRKLPHGPGEQTDEPVQRSLWQRLWCLHTSHRPSTVHCKCLQLFSQYYISLTYISSPFWLVFIGIYIIFSPVKLELYCYLPWHVSNDFRNL
jgi:hypothetical protein